MPAEKIAYVETDGTFHCDCGETHKRGPVNGANAYRCLKCGTTHGMTSDIRLWPDAHPPAPPGEWTVCELMGHRKRAGLVTEVQRFGATLMRIDIYLDGDKPERTEFYSGSAIFALHPCTKEFAVSVAKQTAYQWQPEQPRALLGTGTDDPYEDGEGGPAEDPEEEAF